jgi:hypothetical protein
MGMLPPILVELKANATEFMAKMEEAHHEIEKLEKKGGGHVAKFATVGKAALLGFAGVAIGVGGIAVHAALEGEQAHARLAQSVKNAGSSMEEVEPKVEGLVGKFAKLGYTNDELESGLAVLTTSLRDPQKAMDNIGLAADLARYKHISLADASLVVAKAMEGQMRPMKQLGIDLPVSAGGAAKLATASNKLAGAQDKLKLAQEAVANTTGKKHVKALNDLAKAQQVVFFDTLGLQKVQGTSKQITDALTKAVGGQAAAAAGTYAGKLAEARAQAENLLEKLGNGLLPVIANVISKTAEIVSWFGQHKAAAIALASVIGSVLTAAILTYFYTLARKMVTSAKDFATDIKAGAKWVEARAKQFAKAAADVAKDIAKGAVWVAKKIAQYVAVAASAVVSAATTAAAWIAANAATILATGGIVLALSLLIAAGYLIVKHWHTIWAAITSATQTAYNAIQPVLQAIWTYGLFPLRLYVDMLKADFLISWALISAAVKTAWVIMQVIFDLFTGRFDKIGGSLGSLKGIWGTAWNEISGALQSVWNLIQPILATIGGALDSVASAAERVGSAISKVTSLPGKAAGLIHKIPGLATGGYVSSPTLAMVGEGSEPEYVLPESKLRAALHSAAARGGGGGGSQEIHLYIDGREVHAAVRKSDREFRLRNGASAFA